MNGKTITTIFPLEKQETDQLLPGIGGSPAQTGQEPRAQIKTYLFKPDDSEIQPKQEKCVQLEAPSAPRRKSTLFKCKICGSTVSSDGAEKTYLCKRCGFVQAIPDYCSPHAAFLYGRANHYFRTKRFETALHIFQQIAAEAPDDCEAYRSIVLSRYGVSYDEENGVYSREPRINRVRSDSVLTDPDYISAITLADDERRALYVKEAERIEAVSRDILEIAQTLPSFDAVIEYRGHDSKNRYTPEKAMAEELYRQLEECGFRVYNRQITSPGLYGNNYDAHLYKALYTAKIMFVFASQPEYFNDVRILNEWSIFSERMRNKEKKVIVNCISGIGEDDIPEELKGNKCFDFTEFLFIRRMIEMTEQVVNGTLLLHAGSIATDSEASISERISAIFRLIENGDFSEAENRCHTFLSSYPDDPSAYLGLLLCDMKVRRKEDLAGCREPFVKNKNYRKILLLDKELSAELQGYLDTINDRNIQGIYARRYEQALELYLNGQFNIKSMIKAKNTFDLMPEYGDSRELSEKCAVIIKELEIKESKARADELLEQAQGFFARAAELRQYYYAKLALENVNNAEIIYKGISGSEAALAQCRAVREGYLPLAEELRIAEAEAEKKRAEKEQKQKQEQEKKMQKKQERQKRRQRVIDFLNKKI